MSCILFQTFHSLVLWPEAQIQSMRHHSSVKQSRLSGVHTKLFQCTRTRGEIKWWVKSFISLSWLRENSFCYYLHLRQYAEMVVFQLAAGETQSFVSCQIRDFKYIFLKKQNLNCWDWLCTSRKKKRKTKHYHFLSKTRPTCCCMQVMYAGDPT